MLGHVDQIAARPVRELDGVDASLGADEVADVTDCRTGSASQVQDFRAGLHMYRIDTTQDSGAQFATEGIPDSIFNLGGRAVLVRRAIYRNSLFSIHVFAGRRVERDDDVFLAPRDKHPFMAVRLHNNFSAALGAFTALALASLASPFAFALAAAAAAAALAAAPPAALAAASPSAAGRAEAAHVLLCASRA